MNWKPGDKVMWRYVSAPKRILLVPAIVIDTTEHRITIRALLGDSIAKRNVTPNRLVARTQHFEELDDV